MSDTELLPRCPLCSSINVFEQKAMYASAMKAVEPGEPPEEVKLKLYVCGQCGRMFNEMEGKGEE